jgi:hypothetical protein
MDILPFIPYPDFFLFYFLELLLILVAILVAYRLVDKASGKRDRYRNILRVLAGYSCIILGWYIYGFYSSGYTLYGAALLGVYISGLHVILVTPLLIGVVIVHNFRRKRKTRQKNS